MRNLILLSVFFLFLSGCSKDDTDFPETLKGTRWEVVTEEMGQDYLHSLEFTTHNKGVMEMNPKTRLNYLPLIEF